MATIASDVLYETVKGWKQREFSHSQYLDYSQSPAKYKWKRIFGWREKKVWATSEHGKDVQAAIIGFYQHRDPVEIFRALWAERKTQELHYPERTSWEKLEAAGIGLMRKLVRIAPAFPLKNPVFLDWKDRTLPRIKDEATGVSYVSIPDVIETGTFVADIKCLDHPLPEDNPGVVILDSQLRTQAAATGIYRVVLWVFSRTPKKTLPTAQEVQAVASGYGKAETLEATRKAMGMTIRECGEFLGIGNSEEASKTIKKAAKISPEITVRIEKLSEAVGALCGEDWRIQWLDGEMGREHAMEAVRDELSVVPLIQQQWFPCRCGIRWPNDQALRCPYAGLCLAERTPNATEEMREKWGAITDENLQRWDAEALSGLE